MQGAGPGEAGGSEMSEFPSTYAVTEDYVCRRVTFVF